MFSEQKTRLALEDYDAPNTTGLSKSLFYYTARERRRNA